MISRDLRTADRQNHSIPTQQKKITISKITVNLSSFSTKKDSNLPELSGKMPSFLGNIIS
jgi:hypothetical protein